MTTGNSKLRGADRLKDLGDKYDPQGDYLITCHRDRNYCEEKGYTFVGEVLDGTADAKGTMLVFDRRPKVNLTDKIKSVFGGKND